MTAKALGRGKHGDGQSLYLVKRDKTLGKWILRLSVDGKRREMGLGSWPDVSIAEARERAADARRLLRDGVDPIAHRRQMKRTTGRLTIAEAIDSCFASRKAQLKDGGLAGRWLSPLKVHIVPKLGTEPIETLDQHALKETLLPIWHDKPQAALKALNRINLTLEHAAALGLEVDLMAAKNARALLGKQRHTVQHIPSLPHADTPAFYSLLQNTSGVAALALRFLILTVARTSEVRLATFDEIDGNVWCLSAARTKTGREHRVPLSDEALRVVRQARDIAENEYLFSSYRGKPMSDAAMSKFMRTNGYTARPHGFRSSFRTWCEEQTDFPFEVKEAALGHTVDMGVVGAYQRSDRLEKRRMLMDQWSVFVKNKPTYGRTANKV